jgi:class 3 adenylate cyclase
MRYGPPFQYARRRDGRRLAYQVVGDGDLDLVFLFGWPTHLGLMWEHPAFAGFLGKLSSFSRLVLFDRLGDGLSDRGPTGHTFDDEMDDVRCVLDAAGSRRAAFFGCHTGGRLALLLAATHPDEVSAVVTFGSHPATLRDHDYPWGSTPEEREEVFAAIRTLPPPEVADRLLAALAPREMADPSVRQWWRMFCASASSPVETLEGIMSLGPVDIRGLLGSIQAPVLVLHRTGDRLADVRASRHMAERIPGAHLVELPGDDHLPFFGDQDAVVALTQEFLTGASPVPDPDRVLATVLFTDIVASTERASELGDRRWRELLEVHDDQGRRLVEQWGGRLVKSTGDGLLATFDGPGRAIACAVALREQLGDIDLQIRAGLHAGEVEVRGDDVGGIAVHIAARILGEAAPGEILVSRTVRDLVAGSDRTLIDRGTRRLKGVEGDWQLFAVTGG